MKWVIYILIWAILFCFSACKTEIDHSQVKYVGTSGLSVPVLSESDIVIIESTIAGCYMASELSKKGLDVVLTSSGNSLPKEIAVSMRSWINENELQSLPAELHQLFLNSIKYQTEKGEYVLHTGKITEYFENMLLDAGVRIYYDLEPCKVHKNMNNLITHVLFGGKGGIRAIQTKGVIDCSSQSLLSRLGNASYDYRHNSGDSIVIRYNMLKSWDEKLIDSLLIETKKYFKGERKSIPEVPRNHNITIKNNARFLQDKTISLHGQNAEFRLKLSGNFRKTNYYSDLLLNVKELVYQTASQLNQHKDDSIFFYRPPNDVMMPSLIRIQSKGNTQKTWNKLKLNNKARLSQSANINNLWTCNSSVDVNKNISVHLDNPYNTLELAKALKDFIPEELQKKAIEPGNTNDSDIEKEKKWTNFDDVAKFEDVPPLYSTGKSLDLSPFNIPVIDTIDVVVVGGGTSGLPAALTASDNDISTMLIEKFSGLGGTHTLGGVRKFWFGHKTEFLEQLERDYNSRMKQSNLHKSAAMLKGLSEKNVQILLKTTVIGSITSKDGSRIKGVVISTPNGMKAVKANCVIDATGDGDIAAWSGADYYYGNKRDAFTQWCSFGKYNVEYGSVSRKYKTVVDNRDVTDMTRSTITSRRRSGIYGEGEYPQHYFTVRESRHIMGKDTLTYGKILAGRKYSDLMIVSKSNFDIKGIASGKLVRSGFVCWDYDKNFECGIPYSAILPINLENILVIGKAYSASHDALSLARMQRDMIAMGGAAGIAASIAVKNNISPSQLSISKFQNKLLDYGILTHKDLKKYGNAYSKSTTLTSDEIKSILKKKKLGLTELVSVLMSGEKAIPLLEKAFEKEHDINKKVQFARGLCYLRDTTGVEFLLDNIEITTRDSLPLPKKQSSHLKEIGPPDHGWAPEPAYSIYAIGLTESAHKLTPILPGIINKINSLDDFEYVLSICQAAERSGSRKFIPILDMLNNKDFLSDRYISIQDDPRKTVDIQPERLAYLEFSIGRALAWCGSKAGYEIIIKYLTDMRGFLARSAYEELVDITGKDFGLNPEKWTKWLTNNEESLTSKPTQEIVDK